MVNENMTQPVTRGELHEALGIWAGALRAELATRADLNELQAQLRTEMQQMAESLMARMTHLINGAFENLLSQLGGILDKTSAVEAKVLEVDAKYSDLPPRVEALERKAAGRTKRR